MAFRVAPKLLSTTHDTYRDPFLDEHDYKFYHPQLFTNTLNYYAPDKGSRKFFTDYRRSHITEKTLKNNRERLGLNSPIRPTWNSDCPDRVLGKRKIDRESIFPIIQNNPLYQLSNRIPDRERDRDRKHQMETDYHRLQYKDLTGSMHKKSDYFSIPEPSTLTFVHKNVPKDRIGKYPNHHRAALEFTYDKERAEPLVQYTKQDVF